MRAAGQVLADKYRLVRELGKGGMGSVWAAEHLVLHSQVALKLIESADSDNPAESGHFLREARLAAGLNSQHVVKIFDFGVAEDTPFIAMELLEGETLRKRLQRLGPLAPEQAQQIVRQVARGVERAHRAGIVHRDLKPENVFIVSSDDTEIVKVLDFGLAKSAASSLVESISPATPTGAVLGTPHYMSPEQAMGSKALDQRTDLWSLGVIAYECFTGSVPFNGETLGALIVAVCSLPLPVPSERAQVPAGFDAWFARTCAREPAERFASARELADALDQLCAGAPAAPARELGQLAAVPDRAPLLVGSGGSPGDDPAGEQTMRALELVPKARSRGYLRALGALFALTVLAALLFAVRAALRAREASPPVVAAAPALEPAPPQALPAPTLDAPPTSSAPALHVAPAPTIPAAAPLDPPASAKAGPPVTSGAPQPEPSPARTRENPARKKPKPKDDLGF